MTFFASLEQNAYDYIQKNWVTKQPDEKREKESCRWAKRELAARGAHFGFMLTSPLTSTIETVVGIGGAIATMGTVGTHKPTYDFFCKWVENSRWIIASPFANFLSMINPKAFTQNAFTEKKVEEKREGSKETENSKKKISLKERVSAIELEGNGLVTGHVQNKLEGWLAAGRQSGNGIIRYFGTRLGYFFLYLVASIISRIADAVIGIAAAAAAILTLGTVKWLNKLAVRGLQLPGIIEDIFYSFVCAINPWAGFPSPEKNPNENAS